MKATMSMGSFSTKRESHVLKLVHPGGFVELHATPIMASQVMKNNPRHCVTRPDIFQFPWIVISPESILTPDNVFFIVPCHTIRHLLKSTNVNTKQSSNLDHHCHTERKNVSNPNKTPCFRKYSFLPTSTSCVKLRSSREGHNHKQTKGGKWVQSSVIERYVYSCQYSSHDEGKVPVTVCRFTHSQQIDIPKLKPCLKKDKSHDARSRNLKVRFACNDHDVNNINLR